MPDRPTVYVHVPCGQVHGYVDVDRYQSCACEEHERWEGYDVSEEVQLCQLCARDTAGGPSRWAWLACSGCREAALRFETDLAFGVLLPLGRHSLMNGRFVNRGGAVEIGSLMAMFPVQDQLRTWRAAEVRRLGAGLADDVPLGRWLEKHPASDEASRDALQRFYAAVVAGT